MASAREKCTIWGRRELLCANPNCSYLVHSNSDEVGPFCCGRCWNRHTKVMKGKHAHGEFCERRSPPEGVDVPRAIYIPSKDDLEIIDQARMGWNTENAGHSAPSSSTAQTSASSNWQKPNRKKRKKAASHSWDNPGTNHPDLEGFLWKNRIDSKASEVVRSLSVDSQKQLMELDIRHVRNLNLSAFFTSHAKTLRDREAEWDSTGNDGTVHRSQGSAERTDKATRGAPGTPPLKRPLDTSSQQERDATLQAKQDRRRAAVHEDIEKKRSIVEQSHRDEQQPRRSPQKKQKQNAKPPAAKTKCEADSGSTIFSLRRVEGAPDLPQVIAIRSCDTLLTVGRAFSCDIMLKVQHISKTHAKLKMEETGHEWTLKMEDTSANGTWLNGQRLIAERSVDVMPGDVIAFLPPVPECEQAMYEVFRGAVAPEDGSTTTVASSGTAGAKDIGRWLRSLAGGDLCQYEDILLETYDNLKQIRDLYAEHMEDFFEDIGVESEQHCDAFREGLASLRNVIFL